jgi:acylphosphatase
MFFNHAVKFNTIQINELYNAENNIMVTGKVQDIGFRALIEDIARKLDLGNDVLNGIKNDTSGIKAGFDSFVMEQKEHNMRMDEHNQWMKDHNLRLEKILEKLVEK